MLRFKRTHSQRLSYIYVKGISMDKVGAPDYVLEPNRFECNPRPHFRTKICKHQKILMILVQHKEEIFNIVRFFFYNECMIYI